MVIPRATSITMSLRALLRVLPTSTATQTSIRQQGLSSLLCSESCSSSELCLPASGSAGWLASVHLAARGYAANSTGSKPSSSASAPTFGQPDPFTQKNQSKTEQELLQLMQQQKAAAEGEESEDEMVDVS